MCELSMNLCALKFTNLNNIVYDNLCLDMNGIIGLSTHSILFLWILVNFSLVWLLVAESCVSVFKWIFVWIWLCVSVLFLNRWWFFYMNLVCICVCWNVVIQTTVNMITCIWIWMLLFDCIRIPVLYLSILVNSSPLWLVAELC